LRLWYSLISWEVFTPPTYKNMQAVFYLRSRNQPRTVAVSNLRRKLAQQLRSIRRSFSLLN